MNFEEAYREEITNIINVYHIASISKNEGNYLIDPIKDIVPLCPNCHHMIHRKKDGIYLPEKLRELIDRNQHNRNKKTKAFCLISISVFIVVNALFAMDYDLKYSFSLESAT